MALKELLKETTNIDNNRVHCEKALEICDIEHELRKVDINTKNLLGVYTESELMDIYREESARYKSERSAILDSLM